jgi:predicted enzyme related to lactoylglutathione lyase
MAARVGAEDVFGTGEFYKKAFGLVEVDRLELASGKWQSRIDSFYFDALELGGIEVQAPTAVCDLEITVAMLRDPAGNTIGLLEQL